MDSGSFLQSKMAFVNVYFKKSNIRVEEGKHRDYILCRRCNVKEIDAVLDSQDDFGHQEEEANEGRGKDVGS